ncbi:MAG: GNAT family N-acetyltransferase [Chloroflexota bacterium]
MLTIREAMQAFVAGWVYTRRMERTITVDDFQGMTHLIFSGAPTMRQRFDEFMILDQPAEEVVRLVRAEFADVPHLLTAFTNAPEATVIAYGKQNYHLNSREYLMAVDLSAAKFSAPDYLAVGQVASEEERVWFNTAHEREVIPPRALGDARLGYYYVRFGDDLACEGRCAMTDKNVALIDSVYTAQAYRRRGLGSTLMQAVLADAAVRGATYSVLAASEDGHKLYLTLGYEVLADMLVFEAD